jgi:hypothetical protein
MLTSKLVRLIGMTVLVVAALLGASSATFAEGPPDTVLDLEAGVACPFRLVIVVRGGNQVYKEFLDKKGALVRFLQAGAGRRSPLSTLPTT